MRFDQIDFEPDILDAIDSMNFTDCTPIQEKAIPCIMEGHDLIGVAQTGTGKTAAYLLPILNALSKGGYPENAINCVIMSPTRELAQQIDQQVQGLSYFAPVSSVAVYGGNDGIRYEQERRGLAMGTDIVIATPGRLISHISLGNVDLSRISFFVLDEADRMLDMGFHDDIMQIVSQLPENRQTLLFSATMPKEIQELASKILHNPEEIKLAVSKPADKILQAAYVCYEVQKIPLIQYLLADHVERRIIIFASSKLKVKEIARTLQRLNLNAGEMHSDLDQSQRDEIMLKFRNGKVNILVATDIVARGIDIDDIDLVINFDSPHEAEDYVHRIGRTARAGAEGCAITLVNPEDQTPFHTIERFLEKDIYKIPIPEDLGEGPQYSPSKGHKRSSPHSGGSPRNTHGGNQHKSRDGESRKYHNRRNS